MASLDTSMVLLWLKTESHWQACSPGTAVLAVFDTIDHIIFSDRSHTTRSLFWYQKHWFWVDVSHSDAPRPSLASLAAGWGAHRCEACGTNLPMSAWPGTTVAYLSNHIPRVAESNRRRLRSSSSSRLYSDSPYASCHHRQSCISGGRRRLKT